MAAPGFYFFALAVAAAVLLAGCQPSSGEANVLANGSGNVAAEAPENTPEDEQAPPQPKEAAYPYQVNAELAKVYLKYNITDEALRLFDLAITQQLKQTGSEDAENWIGLADALVKANRPDEARIAYDRALNIYKELHKQAKTNELNNFYVQRIAVLCQVLGRSDERAQYLALFKADEDNAEQQLALASVFEQVGRAEQAEGCYKRALELSQEAPAELASAQVAYGAMLFRAKRHEEALELAKAAHGSSAAGEETRKTARRLLFEIYEATGESEKLKFE